jgi:hypothetical protein
MGHRAWGIGHRDGELARVPDSRGLFLLQQAVDVGGGVGELLVVAAGVGWQAEHRSSCTWLPAGGKPWQVPQATSAGPAFQVGSSGEISMEAPWQ